MRVVFIGCVEFSYSALKHLMEQSKSNKDIELVGVVSKRASKFNSDYKSLEPLVTEAQIPIYFDEKSDNLDLIAWLVEKQPDVVYCLGWSSLLSREVLKIPRLGVIGFHPAALPKNRGRHPIIWTLALGLKETASTFFFMDEGADSGDILNQRFITVDEKDDARSLYQKLTDLALDQLNEITQQLISRKYQRIPQDHTKANIWRKREKADGQIDWRMSAQSIYNLIRALTRPYVGAHCYYNGHDVKIWRAEMVSQDVQNIEPGKVLKYEGDKLTIKCGEGVIRLLEHEFATLPKEGTYL